jgi:hypothetical protein
MLPLTTEEPSGWRTKGRVTALATAGAHPRLTGWRGRTRARDRDRGVRRLLTCRAARAGERLP